MYFWRSIGTGFKYVWKTINIIREIISNLIFFIIILLVLGSIGLMMNPQASNVAPQAGILILDIEGTIVDSTPYDEEFYKLTKMLNGNKSDPSRQNSLFQLTRKIEQAASDPGIRGMILKLDYFTGTDLPSLQYLGKYLTKFKESKKPIYAISSHYDQKQYYLASFADEIYLTSQGGIALYGFAANNLYFKSLLDNLKVNTHIFRVGTYKSAVEPFIRDDMSQEAKENTTRWLTSMWNNYLTDISTNRDKSPDDLVPATDILLSRVKAASGDMSHYAVKNGIVDKIVSQYQFENEMDFKLYYQPKVSIYDYQLYPTRMQSFNSPLTRGQNNKPLIAVVFVNGTIADGESSDNVAGSTTIVKQLRDIRYNNDIHAVVLRINSPGGGVYASEEIRNEIEALREQGIPVVVSMGGMAASGGYWIATQSDYIIANPNTITGSIGIFGMIPTFEDSLSHIGINTDGVSTSPLAGVTITQNLPDEMSQLIQMNIESGYNNFISLVANARNMEVDEVDNIAQGQVWLGEEANKIGLVDHLGDFDDAIDVAATLADLSDYTIDWQKQEKNFFDSLFTNFAAMIPSSTAQIIYNQLPMAKQLKQHITFSDNLNDPQNRYIYCLNCSDVK